MQGSEFEKTLREKFGDYAPEPENNRWNEISAALEEKKKRRGFYWIWFTGLLVAGGISSLIFFNNIDQEEVAVKDPNQADQALPAIEPIKLDSSQYQIVIPSFVPVHFDFPEIFNPFERFRCGSSYYNDLYPFPHLIGADTSKNDSAGVIDPKIPLADTSKILVAQFIEPSNDKLPILSRLQISVGLSSGLSWHRVAMPSEIGNYPGITLDMVRKNYELRKSIEKPGFFLSQQIAVAFALNKHLSVETGIALMQATQYYSFVVRSGPDNVIGPRDFSNQTYQPDHYQRQGDSVFAGNGGHAENHYYYREVPLYLQGLWPVNKKLDIIGGLGVSYRYITGASVYFPDVDNVGFVYLSGKEIYPGLKGTFNASLRAGIRYKFNEAYSFDAMLGYSQMLQSQISFEHWVKQYQNTAGLHLRLTRHFNLNQ